MNILCPEFATYVYNCYQTPVRLLISGGKEIQKKYSPMKVPPPPPHRDPVAMGMCATGLFPLLHLNETSNEMNERTTRLAFVDYFTGVGKLQESRSRWIVS